MHLVDLTSRQSRPVPETGCSINMLPGRNSLSSDGTRLSCYMPSSGFPPKVATFDTSTGRQDRAPVSLERESAARGTTPFFALIADGDLLIGDTIGKIARYSRSSTQKFPVAELENSSIWKLKELPGGNAVLAATTVTFNHGIAISGTNQIVVVDLATGAQRVLASVKGSELSDFTVSGDGRVLALLGWHQAALYDIASGKRIALITTGEKYQMLSATLDTAGEQLVVTAGQKVAVFRISVRPPAA
jgi:hypothetical protein